MRQPSSSSASQDHLRIVFNDRVVVLPIGARATLGDVAQALRDVAPRFYGYPIAIDVTMADASKPGARPDAIRGVTDCVQMLNS